MLNRLLTTGLIVACLVLAFAILRAERTPGGIPHLQPSANQDSTSPLPRRSTLADDQALLGRRVDRIWLDDATLDDLIVKLSDLTKVNLCADWGSLDANALFPSPRLSVHLQNVTLAQALKVALKDLANHGYAFDYVVNDGIVTITAKESAPLITRWEYFNVRPLIDELTGGPGGRWANSNGESGPETQPYWSRVEPVEQIVKLITDQIAPDSWRAAGGVIADLREIDGILVIMQTPENLLAIRQLLENFHRAINTVDFPPLATTLPSTASAQNTTGPASTQLVTQCINIRPLIDELRTRTGWTTSQPASKNGTPEADTYDRLFNLLATAIEPAWLTESPPGSIRYIGGVLVMTHTPAKLRAARALLDKLHRSACAKEFPSAARPATQSDPSGKPLN